MEQFIRILTFSLLFILSMASCSERKLGQDESEVTKELRVMKLDSIANSILESNQVLGFSIAILEKKDTLYTKSFGHLDTDRQDIVKPNTAFPIASVTKSHTSTLALKLQEQDLLDLDDFFVDYFPELRFSDEMKRIKLIHLLNHTSGIPDQTQFADSLFLATGKGVTIPEYVKFFEGKPLHFEPGSRFSYSNTAYVFITAVMEKITGKAFGQMIEEYLAVPLNSKTLDLQQNNIEKSMAAKMFKLSDTIYEKHFINDLTYIGGDGGLSISAIELAHFPIKLMDETLIGKESFDQLTSNTILNSGIIANYGLGIRKGKFQGYTLWGHTGSSGSTTICVLGYFPEHEISIAVMVNTDRTPANALDIFGSLALSVLEIDAPDLDKISIEVNDKELFLGDYFRPIDSEDRHMQIVTYDGDSFLYRKISNSESRGERLHYLGGNAFAPESAPLDRLIFELDENGKVIYFKDFYNGLFMNIRIKK